MVATVSDSDRAQQDRCLQVYWRAQAWAALIGAVALVLSTTVQTSLPFVLFVIPSWMLVVIVVWVTSWRLARWSVRHRWLPGAIVLLVHLLAMAVVVALFAGSEYGSAWPQVVGLALRIEGVPAVIHMLATNRLYALWVGVRE